MIRKILITSGVVLLLALMGFWVYLLLFGAPAGTSEFFTNLQLSDGPTERVELVTGPNSTNGQQVAIGGRLSQLTTRPVAGFKSVTSSSTSKVVYAERGTGHVYEIDMETGTETRISGTTVAKTVDAIFNPSASLVVLVSESDLSTEANLHELGSNNNSVNLGGARNIRFVDEDTVEYTVEVGNSLANYSYDSVTGLEEEEWRIPLKDVDVYSTGTATYVVTRPAPYLEGNSYLLNQSLTRLHEPLYAYQAKPIGGGRLLETYYDFETNNLTSRHYDTTISVETELLVLTLPEKCAVVPSDQQIIWCGAPLPPVNNLERESIRDWYMGSAIFDDELWLINMRDNKATLQMDLFENAGFIIDVTDLAVDSVGENVFFTNKNNDALWRYQVESTPRLEVEEESSLETEIETSTEVN